MTPSGTPPGIQHTRRSAMAGLLALPLAARSAEPPDRSNHELLSVRESVWRAWFGGDGKTLLAILPADFVGISAGEGPFRNRSETITESEGFAAAGNKLTDLRFSDNRIQKIGDVSVIYCGFSFTIQDKAGATSTVSGRATEVFVRSGKRWLHPGWHLDSGR